MMTMMEAIMNRISIRSYIDKRIAKVQTKQVQRILNHLPKPPFESQLRFELVDLTELPKRLTKNIGNIGNIQGAQFFIAGAVQKTACHLEDYGYCLEYIILMLTRIAFGTCWIAENFPREGFARHIHMDKDEILPAIAAMGYFQPKKNLSVQIMKLLAENRERKTGKELFFEDNLQTPLSAAAAGKFQPALEAVRAAPSSMNNQPWIVIKTTQDNTFHFYLKTPGGNHPTHGAGQDLRRVDLGIALCHFAFALEELSIRGQWEKQADREAPGEELQYILSWTENENNEGPNGN